MPEDDRALGAVAYALQTTVVVANRYPPAAALYAALRAFRDGSKVLVLDGAAAPPQGQRTVGR